MINNERLVNVWSMLGGPPYRGGHVFRNIDDALTEANKQDSRTFTYIKTVPLSEWERESGENRREPSA